MCLTVNKNNLNPITAEQDVVCYKVLRKTLGIIFNAPIYNFEYYLGQLYTIRNEYFKVIDICDDGKCLVEYGFHSFAELSDAVRFKERLLKFTREREWEYLIVKCTIPNGARYYTGKQIFDRPEDNSPDGYCSEAIRIDEIVNENEE